MVEGWRSRKEKLLPFPPFSLFLLRQRFARQQCHERVGSALDREKERRRKSE